MTQPKMSKIIRDKWMQFFRICRTTNNKIYSVPEAAKKVGIGLKEFKKMYGTRKDNCWRKIQEFRCATKVGEAKNNGELTQEEAEKYLKENNIPINHLEYFQNYAKEKYRRLNQFNKIYNDFNEIEKTS